MALTPQEATEAIMIEALTLDGNVVGVNVLLYGVPVNYVSKSTQVDGEGNAVGPCEMWLHWGHETGRIRTRVLDESRTVLQT